MKKLTITTITIVILLASFFIVTNVNFESSSKPISNSIKVGSEKKEALKLFSELEADSSLSKATFSGGCFWCLEGPFESMNGVKEVLSGYAGGNLENPTYKQVVSGKTSHRETVQIYYDPELVSFDEILEVYWPLIDPIDDGGQFVDRGSQYTTAIYFHNEEQKTSAQNSIDRLNKSGKYEKEIVTPVLPFEKFYPAEDYHQDFYKHSAERYKKYKDNSGRDNK